MEIGFRLRVLTIQDVKILVNTLVSLNIERMKKKRYPKLYKSGIRYKREGPGREWWKTIDDLLETGNGDCEDLAAARVAELKMLGQRAQPWFSKRGRTWHVQVRYPDGRIEDPSARLGMKTPD